MFNTNFRSLVVFVPNKPSCENVIVHSDDRSKLFNFLNTFFYGDTKGDCQPKPFIDVDLFIEELDAHTSETDPTQNVDVTHLYSEVSDTEPSTRFDNLRDYLDNVMSNFGPDTVVVCSSYQ